ncbi:ankyrin repeat domain-containing protein [Schlesneria sp. T3-172]|uniref:ankyrin repeat domain-containing protein n=1 Tax=Schlesneria sphaerica TaxID=3373610 RepID=UPI0037C6F98D
MSDDMNPVQKTFHVKFTQIVNHYTIYEVTAETSEEAEAIIEEFGINHELVQIVEEYDDTKVSCVDGVWEVKTPLPTSAATAKAENATTRLIVAAELGDESGVLAAISDGANINFKDHTRDNLSPSQLAIINGHDTCALRLFESNANISGGIGEDLWQLAVLHDRPIVAKSLESNGVTAVPEKALVRAAHEGNMTTIQRLIATGTCLNARAPVSSFTREMRTALTASIISGNTDIAILLIEAGADLNAIDGSNVTPWTAAAATDQLGICSILTANGAVADLQSALVMAAHLGNASAINWLIADGADPNGRCQWNYCDMSPLEAACKSPVIRKADSADNIEETRIDVMRLLLDLGADPNDKEAYLPLLIHAAGNNMDDAVELLCEFGADVNAGDRQGKTALHDACSNERLTCLKILLKNGADPNKRDEKGVVPLMDLFCGFIECPNALVAKWLIAFGADPTATSKSGKTVRQYARRKIRQGGDEATISEIIELLDDVESLKEYSGIMSRQPESANDCFARANCCVNWLKDLSMTVDELVAAMSMEPNCVTRVLNALESESWHLRYCAVWALGSSEATAEVIVPAIVHRLEDSDPDVANAAVTTLTNIGINQKADLVVDMLRQRTVSHGPVEGDTAFQLARLHAAIARIECNRDNLETAISEFETAVQLNPSLQTGYWMELSDLRTQAGDSSLEEAIAYYQSGQLAANREDFEEAQENYRNAITTAPGFAWGFNNLAWLLATCPDRNFRDGNTAVSLAKEANRITSNRYFAILDTLAAAYAENGEFEKASVVAERAAQLAPDAKKSIYGLYLKRYLAGLTGCEYFRENE